MKLKEETAARLKWLLTIVITTLGVYIGFKYFLPLIDRKLIYLPIDLSQ
jgi:hypothetical protein